MLSEKAKKYCDEKKKKFMEKHNLKDNCGGDTPTYLINEKVGNEYMQQTIEKTIEDTILLW